MGYAGTGYGHTQTRAQGTSPAYEEEGILTRMHLPKGYEFDIAQEPVRYRLRKENGLLIAEDTNVAEEGGTRFRGGGRNSFEALQNLAIALVNTLVAYQGRRTMNEGIIATGRRLELIIKKTD